MNLNNLAFAPSGEGPLALWLVFEVRADRAPEMAETSRPVVRPPAVPGRIPRAVPRSSVVALVCVSREDPGSGGVGTSPLSVVMSFHRIWIGAGLMIAG